MSPFVLMPICPGAVPICPILFVRGPFERGPFVVELPCTSRKTKIDVIFSILEIFSLHSNFPKNDFVFVSLRHAVIARKDLFVCEL